VLLVPGHDEERLRAAAQSEADALLVDLEAAVPQEQLGDARTIVRGLLPDLAGAGKLVMVRVNTVSSGDVPADLAAVVAPGLYGIALAKIERPRDVETLDRLLDGAERAAGVSPGSVVVHPLIESARAVRRAYGIARASSRVAHMGGIVAPNGDLARSIGFRGTTHGGETRFVRAKVLVDARAAGVKFPLSGIPVERDEDALRRFATEALELGYEGLLIGYRSHAPIVNEIFTPTTDDVARWRSIASGDVSERRAPDAATLAWARDRIAVAARFGVAGAAPVP
jgi:citrate lyase subunit beta/citryl-CoA lyase